MMAPRVKSLCVLMGLFFLGGGLSTLRAEGGASKPLSQIAQEANEAYAKGDLNAAISGYQLLMERDVADPALFYNLGTAYARSGDKGRAVWMFLKARRLDPRNHTIRENLELVAPDADSQIAVFPLLPLELIYGFLSMNGWAAFAACWTVLAAALLLVYFSGRMEGLGRMFLRRTAMVCAIIAAAGHFFAAVKYYEEAYSSRG
ncbi:hypothetical protein HY256_09295, partial [Candidatus Sumerlaeota bacterium]|nr:hypothetical protein [Candidatus Sumerlaeota bacterium]